MPSVEEEIFGREGDTNCDIYVLAVIIGLGGIGSHVADILSSQSYIKTIVMVDDDKVELSNIGRSAFTLEHVGLNKCECCASIISTRNPAMQVYPIPERIQDDVGELLSKYNIAPYMFPSRIKVVIFDCRDSDFRDQVAIKSSMKKFTDNISFYRSAYNELSITVDGNPENHPVMGRDGYTNPSFSISSRLSALMVCIMMFDDLNVVHHYIENNKYNMIDSQHSSEFNKIMFYPEYYISMDTRQIIRYAFFGNMIDRIRKHNPYIYDTIIKALFYMMTDPGSGIALLNPLV
jgi:hypothetical protein